MWNKSKNPSEERIDFLLQNLWNNIFLKTCGCKSHTYCKRVRKMNGLLKERKKRQPSKKRENLSSGSNL